MADEEKRPDNKEDEGESYDASDLTLEEEPTQPVEVPQGLGAGGSHADEEQGHISPMPVLVGVLGALVLLTILTVAVTAVDFGSQGNFLVAMVIATVKALLVMGYFMHLFWDSKFNVLIFGSSFLFASLFFAMTYLDAVETQGDKDAFEFDQKLLSKE